jgi:hypothetical protein
MQKVNTLMVKASTQKNPGMWLYKNDARTPLFMLEAYFRLFENIYASKAFTKCKEQCKTLEDAIGSLDYYAASTAQFKKAGKAFAPYINFTTNKAEAQNEVLNTLLQKKDWLSGKKIQKITKRVEKNKWQPIDKDIVAIKKYYTTSIKKITAFLHSTKDGFKDIELDVHELRRKLRWLSIYPQALQGLIQFKPISSKPTRVLQQYFTPVIVNSPFNKLPTTIKIAKPLPLHKHYYIALSWLIAALGVIKDEGLKVPLIKEAIQHNNTNITANYLDKKIQALLGKSYLSMPALLQKAHQATTPFITENILPKIII